MLHIATAEAKCETVLDCSWGLGSRGYSMFVSENWWRIVQYIQVTARLHAEHLVPSFPFLRSYNSESDSFAGVTKVSRTEPCTDFFLGKWAIHAMRRCCLHSPFVFELWFWRDPISRYCLRPAHGTQYCLICRRVYFWE